MKRLLVGLALVVTLIVVGVLAAGRLAEPWLRRQAVALTAERADSELRLGDLEIDWWPLALVAERASLTLEGETDPYAAVDRLEARVSWRELLNGRVRIEQVVADRPVVSIRVREDGSLALPRFGGDGGGGDRFELRSLELRDGEVRWRDGRLPLEATVAGLRGESTATGGHSSANLYAEKLSVVAGDHRLEFAVDGRVDWEGTQLALIEVRGRQELLDFDVTGSLAGGQGEFEVTADGDLQVLDPWLGAEAGDAEAGTSTLTGRATIGALITNVPEVTADEPSAGWRVTGDGKVDGLRYGELSVAAAPLRFQFVDGRLHAESDGLAAYGGDWSVGFDLEGGRGRVQVDGGGASLKRVASELGWESLATGGRLGGRLDYEFPTDDWRQGRGDADVRVTPGGAWTLAGTVPVQIGQNLTLGFSGTLAGARSRVEMQGAFDAVQATGTVEFTATTDFIPDLQRQLGVSGDFLPTSGAGRLDGRLEITGGPASPALALEADLRNVELASLVAETATAGLRLDGRGLVLERAELTLPATLLEGSADDDRATLTASGEFPSDRRPLRIQAVASRWPVGQLLPLADLEVPVDGLVSGSVDLEIDPRRSEGLTTEGTIDLTLDRPRWDETELGGTVRAPVRIGGGTVEVADGVWSNYDQQLTFDFTTRADGEWQVGVRGDDLVVARWRPGLAFLGESYRVGLDATVRGAESIRSADLRLITAVDTDAAVRTLSGQIVDGRVELAGDLAGVATEVSVDGTVDTQGPRLTARGLVQLTDWIEVEEPELDGSMRLELTSAGSWEQPIVSAEGTEFEVVVAGQTLRQVEPLQAVFEGNLLRLESAYLVNPRTGGELFAAGTADLSSRELDGVVQADLDAAWLGSTLAELTSTGSLSFLGTIEGSVDEPVLDGQGEWADGTARVEGFPHTLREISARFLVGADGMFIDRASAELSGGTINATGSIDLDADRGLSYSTRLVARGINVNMPEDWWVGGDATLRISGDANSRLLSGDVALERAVMLESVDLSVEQILRAAFQRQREWVPSTDEFLRSTRLQLQVSGADALRVGGEGLDLGGDIDLSVAGDLASPLLLGRVDLSTGGRIIFRSNTFEVERGVLLFSNPHVIDPEIDLVAVSQVRSYDVRLHLAGTLDAMDIKFTSDPPLPSLEVVSLLTTGQVGRQPLLLEPMSPTESTAAEGLIAGQAAEVLGSRVGKLFGLDRVQVDPLTESSGSLSSARITVGKRLSSELVATYSYDPTDSEEQVVQLDWQLTPTVAMVLTQNGDGSYAVDFKWQQSF